MQRTSMNLLVAQNVIKAVLSTINTVAAIMLMD